MPRHKKLKPHTVVGSIALSDIRQTRYKYIAKIIRGGITAGSSKVRSLDPSLSLVSKVALPVPAAEKPDEKVSGAEVRSKCCRKRGWRTWPSSLVQGSLLFIHLNYIMIGLSYSIYEMR